MLVIGVVAMPFDQLIAFCAHEVFAHQFLEGDFGSPTQFLLGFGGVAQQGFDLSGAEVAGSMRMPKHPANMTAFMFASFPSTLVILERFWRHSPLSGSHWDIASPSASLTERILMPASISLDGSKIQFERGVTAPKR